MRRTALVTGGASGLGAATAARLRAEGLAVTTLDVSGPADVIADVTDEAALHRIAGPGLPGTSADRLLLHVM
jgi:NAD(P)-dependent dehydrogenase (short-subunit alcohol dehydrogenase family)